MYVHALDCAPAHLSLSLVNSAFMESTFFLFSFVWEQNIWYVGFASVTVKPLGFGGAVKKKNRKIIMFVKKQKDQETKDV